MAVFCGSRAGANPLYMQHAKELGELLAANNIALIYGGGGKGLMGATADAVMNNGGKVVGVIPEVLVQWEAQHTGITELQVVDDMHARKKKLYELCDAAIILPGGFGTLDELFEMLTWNTLQIHSKKIFFLNSAGYYDHLFEHIQKMTEEQFLYEDWRDRITIVDAPAAIFASFADKIQCRS
jgi:uncharacterized protein (TIGR00730 family)